MNKVVSVIVYVPVTDADIVRKALGDAGAGKIGNYSYCSFSTMGIGRFLPNDQALPVVGEIGKINQVPEERIETICQKKDIVKIYNAIKAVHPYEEFAIEFIEQIVIKLKD